MIVEPAGPHELAPLIADAYELSDRERAVTQLVAQGLATCANADRLCISAWSVQDHLKSVFKKTDVCARGELVARLFFEHHAPRLANRLDSDDLALIRLDDHAGGTRRPPSWGKREPAGACSNPANPCCRVG